MSSNELTEKGLGRVLFITLGCAKNEVDTDRMRSLLLSAGMTETTDVDLADVVLINTCSFLAAATQESVEATLDIAEKVQAGVRKRPIVMCGCVPSRYGDSLKSELPEVSAFVKTQEEDQIVHVVFRTLGISDTPTASRPEILRTIEGASAYVKISDGCDRMCSFCAIPYIRGHYVSRPAPEIIQEVRALMEGGVREIVLIGQDTGVWGRDITATPEMPTPNLAWLLRAVAKTVRPYGGWVRVLYLQPEGMTDELIATIRDVHEVLPYIDIPIQHCSEHILSRMRRRGNAEQLRALFARLRQEIPHMVLRTTALVGFPGETDDDFEELYEFIKEQEFDYCSVFVYSREEGTGAFDLDGQVGEEIKLERAQIMQDLVDELGFSATAQHVGETVDVLVDGIETTDGVRELIAHSWFQAPDSDGVLHIAEGSAAVGDKLRCKLVDSFCYELIGELLDAPEDK